MRAKTFHADGRADIPDEAEVASPNFAKTPKNLTVITKPENEGNLLREILKMRSQTNLHTA